MLLFPVNWFINDRNYTQFRQICDFTDKIAPFFPMGGRGRFGVSPVRAAPKFDYFQVWLPKYTEAENAPLWNIELYQSDMIKLQN